MATLRVTLREAVKLLSIVATHFTIPQQCLRVPTSPHSPWQLYLQFFNYGHPSGCEVVS
jgi:hypothetical protein